MESVLLVRYAEIHLKGLNRPFFERALVNAIRDALLPAETDIRREQGRIFVYGLKEKELNAAAKRLTRANTRICRSRSRTSGAQSFPPIHRLPKRAS